MVWLRPLTVLDAAEAGNFANFELTFVISLAQVLSRWPSIFLLFILFLSFRIDKLVTNVGINGRFTGITVDLGGLTHAHLADIINRIVQNAILFRTDRRRLIMQPFHFPLGVHGKFLLVAHERDPVGLDLTQRLLHLTVPLVHFRH